MMVLRVHIAWLLLSCYAAAQPSADAQNTFSLQQVIAEVLKKNYEITLARNDADLARVTNSWIGANAYPTVSGGLNYSSSRSDITQKFAQNSIDTTAVQDNLQMFVSLNWRVFDGFKMFATKKRLEELERSGELAYRNRVSRSIYDASTLYYTIVRMRQQIVATEELSKVFEDRLKIATSKYNLGAVAKNDMLQAQIDLNEQSAALNSLKSTLANTTAALNSMILRSPSSEFSATDSIPRPSVPLGSELEKKILSDNYSLLLANSDLAATLQSRKEIYAQSYPSLSINASYSYTRSTNSAGFSLLNQSIGPSAGVSLSVPLFNGLTTQNQLDANELQISRKEVQIQSVRSSLQLSLTTALNDLRAALSIYETESRNVDLARESARIAIERYNKQSITSPELRQAQYAVIDSQTRMSNALYNAKTAELQLLLLAGSLVP